LIDERWLDDASCVALLLLLPPLLDMLEVKKEASGFVARWLFLHLRTRLFRYLF
jgi:hypothetical protein